MFNDYFDPDKAARQNNRRATDIDAIAELKVIAVVLALIIIAIVT